MKNMQTPSEQLRTWREYCRLTSTQVAQYTGIPESMINAIEQGRVYPDMQTADRLNRFFAQYPAVYNQNLQTQQMRTGVSQPTGFPNQASGPAQSYPSNPASQPSMPYTVAAPSPTQSYPEPVSYQQPPAQSYPGTYIQPAQSYPGTYIQPAQSYPRTYVQPPVQSYPGQQIQTQQSAAYTVQPATVQQSRYYAQQPVKTQTSAGLSVLGAIFQIIIFCIPIIFIFFAFMDLPVVDYLSGIGVGNVFIRKVPGVSILIYPHYFFSFAALATQIGLWLTLIAGVTMIILSVLRIFGFNLFAVRTVFFYIYLVGVLACIVGISVATVNELTRWAYIAYTLATVVALVFRIILDGGMRAFAIRR